MRMSRGFSMDTLRPHEYDIPLDRGGPGTSSNMDSSLILTQIQPGAIGFLIKCQRYGHVFAIITFKFTKN